MHHPTDRIAHTTAFVTPVVQHWLERETSYPGEIIFFKLAIMLRKKVYTNLNILYNSILISSLSVADPDNFFFILFSGVFFYVGWGLGQYFVFERHQRPVVERWEICYIHRKPSPSLLRSATGDQGRP